MGCAWSGSSWKRYVADVPCAPVAADIAVILPASRWRRTSPSSSSRVHHTSRGCTRRGSVTARRCALPHTMDENGLQMATGLLAVGVPSASRRRRPGNRRRNPGPGGSRQGRPRRPGASIRRHPGYEVCTPCDSARSSRVSPDVTNRGPECPECPEPGCRPSPDGCWFHSRARRLPSPEGRSRTAA